MDLGDCYRLLGLRSGASFVEIKASYRRLVQQYHPDLNPDDTKAKEKFIALTEAYKLLQTVVLPDKKAQNSGKASISDDIKVTPPQPAPSTTAVPQPANLSAIEQRLKWKTYEQLQRFLQEKQFPQAIALVEALAARLPTDAEVRQWQAIAYQIWGRALIGDNQLLKARIYLKKALKTDPKNKTLWQEVQRDFQRLEQIF
ncbi:DnaJ-class molecular chaperone with C-terminal Zn finger domain [Cylindrospermum stagnale PCC 7417]|uniref:DnaJ-class molecular chaperone with C-terminal Zn finger domain n=1 Tax=Cylindrospermum stagnale PCC 7417 TaxID=56107 RepID=K9WT65_9NOST|nr:J domain-containing protein [Cylindrospermum stagnale]AFZ22722.1 DnaJ-class molecular chaperone with C-terminal Zn finger domain [Cylindrospermum stagnale PCC 7417]